MTSTNHLKLFKMLKMKLEKYLLFCLHVRNQDKGL